MENNKAFAEANVTEPLLLEFEALVDRMLAAGIDAHWIIDALETKIYGVAA